TSYALLYLDLDQFKIVNDSCGHSAGDLLLQQLTGVFRQHIRSVDLFARIGGDEFALLLEHCSPADSRRIANQLRSAVADFRFFWQARCFSVGVSIGVVPIHAGSGSTSRIMSLADASCYIAKQQGRNRVHLCTESDTQIEAYDSDIRRAARLQSLNIDYLKIDGQFVSQVLHSDVDLRILDAIVQLGRSLRITTIAECVESELVFRKLEILGVDLAQGYYLQEPVRLGEYRHKIRNTPAISSE
ncbi:MAG: bifunctional diguanylate cyclase/phosphodiesterase, partial [Thiogranum sp.]